MQGYQLPINTTTPEMRIQNEKQFELNIALLRTKNNKTELDKKGSKDFSAIVGLTVNKLEIIKHLGLEGKSRYYMCKCECGKIVNVVRQTLLDKRQISCGCYKNPKVGRQKRKYTAKEIKLILNRKIKTIVIAEKLGVSPNTVSMERRRLEGKLK